MLLFNLLIFYSASICACIVISISPFIFSLHTVVWGRKKTHTHTQHKNFKSDTWIYSSFLPALFSPFFSLSSLFLSFLILQVRPITNWQNQVKPSLEGGSQNLSQKKLFSTNIETLAKVGDQEHCLGSDSACWSPEKQLVPSILRALLVTNCSSPPL